MLALSGLGFGVSLRLVKVNLVLVRVTVVIKQEYFEGRLCNETWEKLPILG